MTVSVMRWDEPAPDLKAAMDAAGIRVQGYGVTHHVAGYRPPTPMGIVVAVMDCGALCIVSDIVKDEGPVRGPMCRWCW